MDYVMSYKMEDDIVVEMLFFDYVGLKWILYYATFDGETDEMVFRIMVPMTTSEATEWFDKYRQNKENEVA